MAANAPANQWGWAEMEELLQCPVCFDPPKGIVEQCVHGHHICSSCRSQVENCPLCKSRYTGTRNFVVEELIRNFEIVKNTMLLCNLPDERNQNGTKLKKRKKKTVLNLLHPRVAKIPHTPTPNCTKGAYPCRMANCGVSLPLGRLLNHVRTYHAGNLTENTMDASNSYLQTWLLTYRKRKTLTRMTYPIFVSGVGLIFLTIEILPEGELIAIAQLASKFKESSKFHCTIKIYGSGDGGDNQSYSSPVTSCKRQIDGILQEYQCLLVKQTKFRNICGASKQFNVNINIFRRESARFPAVTTDLHEEYKRVAHRRKFLMQKEEANALKFSNKKNNELEQKPSHVPQTVICTHSVFIPNVIHNNSVQDAGTSTNRTGAVRRRRRRTRQ